MSDEAHVDGLLSRAGFCPWRLAHWYRIAVYHTSSGTSQAAFYAANALRVRLSDVFRSLDAMANEDVSVHPHTTVGSTLVWDMLCAKSAYEGLQRAIADLPGVVLEDKGELAGENHEQMGDSKRAWLREEIKWLREEASRLEEALTIDRRM